MSYCRDKRHRSRSRSSVNKRESQHNRNKVRSKDYDRPSDSYEGHHHSTPKNTQYNYRHTSDLTGAPIDEIITNADGHPPIVQPLVREILLERQKRQLIDERLNMREHDYALLHAQHEQTINNMTLLKREYDQCRLDLQNSYIELNEVRHNNQQLRVHIDHLLNDERQQMYSNDAMLYEKRQRRH